MNSPARTEMIRAQVKRGAPTFTGKFVDPLDLQVEDIDVRDIAHHLSLANRYMGATDLPYSVAQHSVLVARIVWRDQKRAALFHDAAEAYFGDLSRVIKYNRGFGGMIFRQEEAKAARVIERALDFEPNEFDHPDIKWADDLIGEIEWNCLVARTGDRTIIPWSPAYAEEMFLDAAGRYV